MVNEKNPLRDPLRRESILNTNELKDGSTLDFYNKEHWPDLRMDDYTEEDL